MKTPFEIDDGTTFEQIKTAYDAGRTFFYTGSFSSYNGRYYNGFAASETSVTLISFDSNKIIL